MNECEFFSPADFDNYGISHSTDYITIDKHKLCLYCAGKIIEKIMKNVGDAN